MAADVDLNRNIVEFRGFSLYSKFLPLPHLNRNIVEFREQTVVFYSDSAF